VDTGSRLENASNKEIEPPFRFDRDGKGSSPVPQLTRLGGNVLSRGIKLPKEVVHSGGHAQ
jgi:hypothetical protein